MSALVRSGRVSGFTLVELVVALTLSAILVGFIAMLISGPVDAYFDQSERSRLNEDAELISRSFSTDLRSALPNSVRIRNVGSRSIVEFLRVTSVSIYRPTGSLRDPPDAMAHELDFDVPQDTFSVFGRLNPDANLDAFGRYDLTLHLVINNRGANASNPRNAYRLGLPNSVITPSGATITVTRDTLTGAESVQLPAGFSFVAPELPPEPQPSNRIFAVAGPVTYICNSTSRTLRKYENYPISANIATSEAAAQFNTAGTLVTTLASNVGSCSMRCAPGGSSVAVCQEILVLDMTVTRSAGANADRIKIFEQVPLDNAL